MSWLFGIVGRSLSVDNAAKAKVIHGESLYSFSKDREYYVAAGGNRKTCFGSTKREERGSFWIGLGCTFYFVYGKKILCSQNEWELLSTHPEEFNSVDGHYVHMNYFNNSFQIRTDRLGLRTLYWYRMDDATVFSSRLDWLTQYRNGGEIEYESLGSRWLLFNQLSYSSLVKDVHRLGPDAVLTIRPNTAYATFNRFLPDFTKQFSYDRSVSAIRESLNAATENGSTITLGLSGGLDSRTLLALLLQNTTGLFHTHTFGNKSEPDVFIPGKMAEQERFANSIYDTPMPSQDNLSSIVISFVRETNLIEPATSAFRFQPYCSLDNERYILVDGGFGEIARRQYLNRLAAFGKYLQPGKDVEYFFKKLQYHRGSFFSDDILKQLNTGAKNDIELMFKTMPSMNDIGLENYLDLLAVRTRIPNFGADAQGRLDTIIQNFMPFVQLSFLNEIFSMPISLRKEGRFFKKLIKDFYPALSAYPLVKNRTTYPFTLSTKGAYLFTTLKSRLARRSANRSFFNPLRMMKEFAYDTLTSRRCKEHSAYNFRKINFLLEEYYGGKENLASEVNWLLTFELWRQTIEMM